MSATLTPERKSARDRPGVGHKVGDWGRESGGARSLPRPRSSRPVGAACSRSFEMINARGRALAVAHLMTQQSEPFLSRQSARLPLASTAANACQSRRQSLPPPCSPSIIRRQPRCRRPRRRHPAWTPYRHPLSLLLSPPVCLSRRHRRHTCVSRARRHA